MINKMYVVCGDQREPRLFRNPDQSLVYDSLLFQTVALKLQIIACVFKNRSIFQRKLFGPLVIAF